MPFLPPEDVPSSPLNHNQIRDFRRRALAPLTTRLAMGEVEWERVAVDRELWCPNGERQRIEFFADRDTDSGDVSYTLIASVAIPFDKQWAASVVYQRVGLANTWGSDESDAEGTVIDGSSEEFEDQDDYGHDEPPVGYWGREASYIMRVPHSGHRKPTAQTDISFSFYDEDFYPVDAEVVTSRLVVPGTNLTDVANLVRFGETMLMQDQAEEGLITMTEYDAVFVLNVLKGAGLVSRACKPFTTA